MKFFQKFITLLVLSPSMAVSVVLAQAVENDGNLVHQAKITLEQAVKAAIEETGGVATRSVLKSVHGKLIYEVEILIGNAAKDVKVDANDGKVLSVVDDKVDAPDADDPNEDEDE